VLIGPVVDVAARSLTLQAVALGLDGLREPPASNLLTLREYARCGPGWYLAQARHMLRYPTRERVAQLDHPAVIVRGAQDRVAGARWCAELAAEAGRAVHVETVPGAGHLVHHTHPAHIADIVRRTSPPGA
jgi:pimeloyl-ACP methyl ester carboxylesterase